MPQDDPRLAIMARWAVVLAVLAACFMVTQ